MPFTPVSASDPVAPLENILNTRFTELDNSITASGTNRQILSFKWANAAARTAQIGMAAGDIGYQIDTAVSYRYSGTAWVAWQTGVRLRHLNAVTGTIASGTSLGTIVVPRQPYAQRVLIDIDGQIAPVGGAGNCGITIAASAGGTAIANTLPTPTVPNGTIGAYARNGIFDIAAGAGADVTFTFALSVASTATSAQVGVLIVATVFAEGQY